MMNNKLQYKFSPDFIAGLQFQHEWKIDSAYPNDIATLKEMVAWCYEIWDDDPSKEFGEWEYELSGDSRCLYVRGKACFDWMTVESPKRFYLGTNDEQWAVTFKVMWSDFIE